MNLDIPAPETDLSPPTNREAPPASARQPSWLHQGWRAAWGLRLADLPPAVSAGQMLGLILLSNALLLLALRAEIPGPAVFSLSGWLYSWTPVSFLIGLVWWAFARSAPTPEHAQPVAAWLALYWVGTLPLALLSSLWAALAAREALPLWADQAWVGWAIFLGLMAWLSLVIWRITQRLNPRRAAVGAVVVGVVLVQVLSSFWLRAQPWQEHTAADAENPQLELSQDVFEDQERLLTRSLAAIAPRGEGSIQVFGLVYAPYAQDVFLRESQLVSDLLRQRMGAQDRVLTLLNHPSATQTSPWATPRNLRRAIHSIAQKMNREQDVLLLYFTSHGGADHQLASQHGPLDVPTLGANELRQWLDEADIRYRAIGVSACFSGGWVAPLSDDNSLVMTAADAEHTSYGCGSRSELTFFTRAVFDEALRHTLSLEDAFASAVPRIREREQEARKSDGFSNPQIQVGADFRAQWARWMAAQTRQP